jgi:hypothetical protein
MPVGPDAIGSAEQSNTQARASRALQFVCLSPLERVVVLPNQCEKSPNRNVRIRHCILSFGGLTPALSSAGRFHRPVVRSSARPASAAAACIEVGLLSHRPWRRRADVHLPRLSKAGRHRLYRFHPTTWQPTWIRSAPSTPALPPSTRLRTRQCGCAKKTRCSPLPAVG